MTVSINYRETDTVNGLWVGLNTELSNYQIDQNFYALASAVTTLQANLGFTVSIAYITVHGDQMTIHMTDHSTQGPFTIPIAAFVDRGTWAPLTPYNVNDTFQQGGTLYLVIFAHTSQATFSAGANDGAGHNYYSAMLTIPSNVLPTGGATGQALVKSSGANFACTWAYPLPTGGTAGQILLKNSSTNQDASWGTSPFISAPADSPSGLAGQVPATFAGSATDMEWVSVVYAPAPSPAGTPGQMLATVDGTAEHMEWVNPPAGVTTLAGLSDVSVTENSGINGYYLTYNNSISKWVATALPSSFNPTLSSVAGGDTLFYNDTGTWVNRPNWQDLGNWSASLPLGNTSNYPRTVRVQPTGSFQITIGAHVNPGDLFTVVIHTSGTTSYNITGGSGVLMNGTLATGSVNSKWWTLQFVYDASGSGLIEISRSGPL